MDNNQSNTDKPVDQSQQPPQAGSSETPQTPQQTLEPTATPPASSGQAPSVESTATPTPSVDSGEGVAGAPVAPAEVASQPLASQPAEVKSGGGFRTAQKVGGGVAVLLLVVGLAFGLNAATQQTNLQQRASAPEPTIPTKVLPSPTITNLNSTTDTLEALNSDGTMGPQTSQGNWSNSQPSVEKGKLAFGLSSTSKDKQGNPKVKPTNTKQSKENVPSQADEGITAEKGEKTVTSLKLNISKVEVHRASTGTGGKEEGNSSASGKEKLSDAPGQGQVTDHWETLTVPATTIDLIEIAKTNNFQLLGLTPLAAGKYTEVRLYVKSATATFSDGKTVSLTIPGKNGIVKIVHPFTIAAGVATTLTMDFDAEKSVVIAGSEYHLKPVVAKLLEEKQ